MGGTTGAVATRGGAAGAGATVRCPPEGLTGSGATGRWPTDDATGGGVTGRCAAGGATGGDTADRCATDGATGGATAGRCATAGSPGAGATTRGAGCVLGVADGSGRDGADVDGGAVIGGGCTARAASAGVVGLGTASGGRDGTAGGDEGIGAGVVVVPREGPVDANGGVCKGGVEPPDDATGGFAGDVGGRCATARPGTGAGFGADGASRKMTSDSPANPIATAALPYRSSAFKGGVPRAAARGYPSVASTELARPGRPDCSRSSACADLRRSASRIRLTAPSSRWRTQRSRDARRFRAPHSPGARRRAGPSPDQCRPRQARVASVRDGRGRRSRNTP